MTTKNETPKDTTAKNVSVSEHSYDTEKQDLASEGIPKKSIFDKILFPYTVGNRIALSFFVILLLMAFMVYLAFDAYNKEKDHTETIKMEINKQNIVKKLRSSTSSLIISTHDYFITGKDDYYKNANDHYLQAKLYQKELSDLPLTEEERLLVQSIKPHLDSIYFSSKQVLSLKRPVFSPEAIKYLEIIDNYLRVSIIDSTTEIINISSQSIENKTLKAEALKKRYLNFKLFSFLISFLICIAVYFLFRRKIAYPVKELIKSAEDIADGDFSIRPNINDKGEMGRLAQSLSTMAESIQNSHFSLKENENRLNTIFESIPDALLTTNNKGVILSFNHETVKMFGYADKELTNQPINMLIPDRYRGNHEEHMKNYHQQPAQRKMDTDLKLAAKRKDGSEFPIEVSLNPFEFRGENRVLCVVRDITDRKLARDKIKQSEERLKQAQAIAHLGYWNLDLIKDKLECSDEVFRIFEIEPQEFKGTYEDFLAKVHPDDRIFIDRSFKKSLRDQTPFHITHRILTKSGQVKYVTEQCQTQFNSTGLPILSLGTIQDVTSLKQIENELIIAKEIAEENNQLKTAFLQNLSHEVRTPMNAINGFSDLLNDPEITEEKRKKYISIIQKSSSQLLSIITDILTISSLETKQEKLMVGKINVNKVLANLLAIYETQILEKNIELKTSFDLDDQEANVLTDRTKLVQILTNLINNALKFTDKGSIEFGYVLKDTNLEFFVRDSGIGMREEAFKKVFERFTQADNTIAPRFGGTGLGLSISKEFVELLGGKIWVQSEEGSGSTFYFTIPYVQSVEIENKSEIIDYSNKKELTVLVAEDEEYNFELIYEILSRLKVKIIHAQNGQQAVNLCRENSEISLVLMDIKMPRMDGVTATKLIKEFRPGITIIAQTGYAMQYEIVKFKDQGFDDIITKPIKKEELLSKVLNFKFSTERK